MKSGFALVFAFLAALPGSALAYLDPGAGSALLQGILAALVSAAVVVRMYWHQLLAFLRKLFKRTDTQDEDSPSSGNGR